jgi:hypothetical protein
MDLIQHDQGRNHKHWSSVRAAGTSLPESRNLLAKHTIESDVDWLFMVDADMGFEPDTLDRLLAVADPVERPVVGGLAFAYKEQGMDGLNGTRAVPLPTILDWHDTPEGGGFKGRLHYPVNALVRTGATGAACILIHRTVLESIRDQFGETWFDRIMGPEGLRGEDVSFCMRVGAAGFPTYVHTGIRTNHQKTIFVSETDFWTSFEAPPATERVDVIVPTVKSRVDKIEGLARSLWASTGLARLVLVVDDDEHAGMVSHLADEVIVEPGSFAHKLNVAFDRSTGDAPWLKFVGDDCKFRAGWLDHLQHVAKNYGAKVVGSNDLANPRVVRGEHATHWMVARDYIAEVGASWDGPGVWAHEGYRHNFVDDEIVSAAIQRGVFQVALGSIVEHFHPMTGKAETDDVYEECQKHFMADARLFEKRLKQAARKHAA